EGNSPPNSPLQPPMIILKFLYPQVPLVEKILIPYAKPEHVIAGYFRDTDEEMVLGCYILVHVAKPEDSEDHLYLIGTQVKISEMTMKIWQNQRMQFGKFIVASGLVSEEQPDEVLFTDPLWTCICTEF